MRRSTTLFLKLLRSDVMRGRKWAIKWPKQLTPSFVYLTRGPLASRRLLLSTSTQKTSDRVAQDLPNDVKLIKIRLKINRIMFTQDPSLCRSTLSFPLNGSTHFGETSAFLRNENVRFSVSLMADPILGNAVSFCVWTWLPSFFKGLCVLILTLSPLGSRADTCPFRQKEEMADKTFILLSATNYTSLQCANQRLKKEQSNRPISGSAVNSKSSELSNFLKKEIPTKWWEKKLRNSGNYAEAEGADWNGRWRWRLFPSAGPAGEKSSR